MIILDSFEPSSTWYQYNPYGIHGIGHATRVLVWAEQISTQMIKQHTYVDKEVVRWAAVIHDVGRIDDGQDLQHGQRTAEWIRKSTEHRLYFDLDESQIRQLLYCCIWHVPDDTVIPHMTPELVCLKDADGLDRVRLNDLRPSFLRTDCAREFVAAASHLFEEIDNNANTVNAWEVIRDRAIKMDIWR